MSKTRIIQEYPYPENLFRTICNLRDGYGYNDAIYTRCIEENLVNILDEILTDRERNIIKCRFEDKMSFIKISQIRGLRATSIRAIERRILLKIGNSPKFFRSIIYHNSLDSDINYDVCEKINMGIDIMIDELDIPTAIIRTLKRHKIHMVSELVTYSEPELLNMYNMGIGRVGVIRDILSKIGLQLRPVDFKNRDDSLGIDKDCLLNKTTNTAENGYARLSNFIQEYIRDQNITTDELAVQLIAIIQTIKTRR